MKERILALVFLVVSPVSLGYFPTTQAQLLPVPKIERPDDFPFPPTYTTHLNTSAEVLNQLQENFVSISTKFRTEGSELYCPQESEPHRQKPNKHNEDNDNDNSCSFKNAINHVDIIIRFLQNQAKFLLEFEVDDNTTAQFTSLIDYQQQELHDAHEIVKKWMDNLRSLMNSKSSTNLTKANKQSDLNETFHHFQYSIEQFGRELQIVRRNVTAKLIIGLIHTGDISRAKIQFKKVFIFNQEGEPESELVTIVHHGYNGKLENFDKVINLIEWTGENLQKAGYPALYTAMKESNHSHSPDIIILAGLMKDSNANFTDYEYELVQAIQQVLNKWADQIKMGDNDEIHSFYEKYNTTRSKLGLLNSYLKTLLQTVYTSIDEYGRQTFNTYYFDHMLEFVVGLPNASSQVYGYSSLQSGLHAFSLDHSKQTLKLTYRVKQLIDDAGNDIGPGLVTHKLNILVRYLPRTFKQIIWGGTCYIRNSYLGEYMYASNVKDSKTGKREVFTWIPREKIVEGRWKLEPVENATYFNVVSYHWREDNNKYLCDDRTATSYEQNQLKTCDMKNIKAKNVEWKLEPVYDEYARPVFSMLRRREEDGVEGSVDESSELAVFAGGVIHARDHDRRRVFTWATTNKPVGGYWVISCEM